jgi:FixJ family two-component response regulator
MDSIESGSPGPESNSAADNLVPPTPYKAIAFELNVSEGTVKVHLHSIFQELGIESRVLLIAQSETRPAA